MAHILASRKLTNIVVTPNFDPLLSRALDLFAEPHINYDHPHTINRVDPERDDIQIVHVHGSHLFYDICNTSSEIRGRAEKSPDTVLSVASKLDLILSRRSPLVVGYSGWEDDVIMTTLKRRLATEMPYNIYWFCYRESELDSLPGWLKDSIYVKFVIPEKPIKKDSFTSIFSEKRTSKLEQEGNYRASRLASMEPGEVPPTLPAHRVFEEIIRSLNCEMPGLIPDPLGFYATNLKKVLPEIEDLTDGGDIYSFGPLIWRIRQAKECYEDRKETIESQLEDIRNAVRNTQYHDAIDLAKEISINGVESRLLPSLMSNIQTAVAGIEENWESKLIGYDLILNIGKILASGKPDSQSIKNKIIKSEIDRGVAFLNLERHEEALSAFEEAINKYTDVSDTELAKQVIRAYGNKGVTLSLLDRREDTVAAFNEIVVRFGEATEIELRRLIARALASKGYYLAEFGCREEAIAVYDEVVTRFGEATETELREQVARVLGSKGYNLSELGRAEEAIAAYDEVVARFDGATEIELRKLVAWALIQKGEALSELDREEESIAAYDEAVTEFGGATELELREQVAWALILKGEALGEFGRREEAIALYDEVVTRFGEATEIELRKLVAWALILEGGALSRLERAEEAIAACDEVVTRFGEVTEMELREQVARAFVSKGMALNRLERAEEAIAAYDEVVTRFGEATEMELREQVAWALILKGAALDELGRQEEAIAAYDKVVTKFGEAPEQELREQVARALVNKGDALNKLNKGEEAIVVCNEVLASFGKTTEQELRGLVAVALANKGEALTKLNQLEEAAAVYQLFTEEYKDALSEEELEEVLRAQKVAQQNAKQQK